MEWISGVNLAGLPWWAVFVIALLTFAATKGIDALIRWRKNRMEERQYDDGQAKAWGEALIEELRNRIEKLEGIVEKQNGKLDTATAAHAKCEVEQERLRGELNVMKEKVARLESHDQKNAEHVAGFKEALKQIDPEAATKVP